VFRRENYRYKVGSNFLKWNAKSMDVESNFVGWMVLRLNPKSEILTPLSSLSTPPSPSTPAASAYPPHTPYPSAAAASE
jgi:hypothetical protein